MSAKLCKTETNEAECPNPEARSPMHELVDMPKNEEENEEEEERTLLVLLPPPLLLPLLPPCNVSVYVPKCKCMYVSRLSMCVRVPLFVCVCVCNFAKLGTLAPQHCAFLVSQYSCEFSTSRSSQAENKNNKFLEKYTYTRNHKYIQIQTQIQTETVQRRVALNRALNSLNFC